MTGVTIARLDQMLVAGRITLTHWLIADEYRRLSLSASARGGGSFGFAAGAPAGFGGGATGLAVAASHAARLAEVNRAIGADAARLLRMVLVEELSWRAIGRALAVNHETAEARAIVALAALAEAWRRPRRPLSRRVAAGTRAAPSGPPPGRRAGMVA